MTKDKGILLFIPDNMHVNNGYYSDVQTLQ